MTHNYESIWFPGETMPRGILVRIGLSSEAVLRDLWNSFWSLPWVWRRIAVAGAVFVVALTIGFWQFMIPMFGFALVVAA